MVLQSIFMDVACVRFGGYMRRNGASVDVVYLVKAG
jgi:hypothetical protein